MKAPVVRDLYRRQNFKNYEEKIRLFKTLKTNTSFKLSAWAQNKMDRFGPSSYKNRCLITYRGKAISRKFKLSRQEFKRWAESSRLPGLGPKY